MDYRFFKTSIVGGFDKIDVLEYIKKMTVENKISKEKLEKELKESNRIIENIISEKQLLTNEINELVLEKEKIEVEKNNILKDTKVFKGRYDDIAKILLEIEDKRKISIDETNKERDEIINNAKIEADKIINKAKEISNQNINIAEVKYKQTINATIELANLIDNSRKVFNKISDEAINLIKKEKLENE